MSESGSLPQEHAVPDHRLMSPILRVEGLNRSFGGISAVRDCSFELEPATITALIGPNGAGKTTVFNLISGFIPPSSGSIVFRDQRIDGLAPHRIFDRGLIRTFQIPRQFQSMSVIENLMIVPSNPVGENFWSAWLFPRRIAAKEEATFRRAEELLDFVKLSHLRDQPASDLSGGQKKLLELARTLLADPQMIMLDEPGAGINPALMHELMGHVESLRRERGITFLLVEHNMELVTESCDRAIVMNEGMVLVDGRPTDVVSRPEVLDAYLGSKRVAV